MACMMVTKEDMNHLTRNDIEIDIVNSWMVGIITTNDLIKEMRSKLHGNSSN